MVTKTVAGPEHMPSYLSLTGYEWYSLFDGSLQGDLIACCPQIESLRKIIENIYAIDINFDLAIQFTQGYNLVCEMHDMRYSQTLHRLAAWVCRYLDSGFHGL